ncbi:hypothetical protein U1Q18_009435, partial [Sarracenia purpurea var. burkii]
MGPNCHTVGIKLDGLEREGSDAGVEERRHGWRNISSTTLARSVGSSSGLNPTDLGLSITDLGVPDLCSLIVGFDSFNPAELQRIPSCRRYRVGSPDLVKLWLVSFRLLASSCHLPLNWA